MVSFALIFPVLLVLTFGILEFALALMDRQQAAEGLRRFSRAVAISVTTGDLSNISNDAATTCTYSDASVNCDNGSSIANWTKLTAGYNHARAIFPTLTADNIVIIFEPTDLAPDEADRGTMALVTIQFQNLVYKGKVFPFYNSLIERILFPTMSNSLIVGG